MAFQSKYLVLAKGTAIFAALFVVQMSVHLFANVPLVELLASDGCGQKIDFETYERLQFNLKIDIALSALFSILFAYSVITKQRPAFFRTIALLSTLGFVMFFFLHQYSWEHLTSCDIFFAAPLAPVANFAMILIILFLTVIAERYVFDSKKN